MWTTRCEQLPNSGGLRIAVDRDQRPATVAEVLDGWQSDAALRSGFTALLAAVPFAGFRWEVPAITADTANRAFECVVLDAPSLVCTPNPEAFAEHFTKAEGGIAVFANLRKDALLVVPCPLAEHAAYGHLAAFVRLAPQWQQHALWQTVGEAMVGRIGARPVWLSTAGAGVAWLHVRLDDRPKYYAFEPYR